MFDGTGFNIPTFPAGFCDALIDEQYTRVSDAHDDLVPNAAYLQWLFEEAEQECNAYKSILAARINTIIGDINASGNEAGPKIGALFDADSNSAEP